MEKRGSLSGWPSLTDKLHANERSFERRRQCSWGKMSSALHVRMHTCVPTHKHAYKNIDERKIRIYSEDLLMVNLKY